MEYRVKRMETRTDCWSRVVDAADEYEAREKFDEWFGEIGYASAPDEEHVADCDYLVDPA